MYINQCFSGGPQKDEQFLVIDTCRYCTPSTQKLDVLSCPLFSGDFCQHVLLLLSVYDKYLSLFVAQSTCTGLYALLLLVYTCLCDINRQA